LDDVDAGIFFSKSWDKTRTSITLSKLQGTTTIGATVMAMPFGHVITDSGATAAKSLSIDNLVQFRKK
jgi:hypothetical protein